MDTHCGRAFWKSVNGQRAAIDGPKRWCVVSADLPDGTPISGESRREERWSVTCSGGGLRGGHAYLHESQLRPIHGEELSTWTRFAKVTGLRLNAEPAMIPVKTRSKRSEVRHG